MHCKHGEGVSASLMTLKSLTSDNAARATSREVIELQKKQAAELRKLSDEALRQAPKRLEHAAKTWLAMSEEQRKVVEKGTGTHELGCTGHSLNLTIDDSHKKTEKPVLEANIVRDLAVNAIHRATWRCLFNKKQSSLGLTREGRRLRQRWVVLRFHDWGRLVEGRLGGRRGEETEGGQAHLEARRPHRPLAEVAPGGQAPERHRRTS